QRPVRNSLATLYRNLFHGTLFQVVRSLDRIGDTVITSRIVVLPRDRLFRSTTEPNWILDPVLVDVSNHPHAGWHLEQPDQSGRILLPVGLDSIEFFGPPPPARTQLTCQSQPLKASSRHFTHRGDAIGPDGRLCFRLQGAKYWRFYVPFGDVNFHGPKDEYFLCKEWPQALATAQVAPQAVCMMVQPP